MPALFRVGLVPGEGMAGAAVPAPSDVPQTRWPRAGRHDHLIDVGVELVRGEETLSAPRLAVFPGQRAIVSVLNQTSYVEEFDVELASDVWIADPIVGVVAEGVTIELVARNSPSNTGEIDVALHVRESELLRPIETRNVTLAADSPAGTVQVPKTLTAQTTAVARLRPGIAQDVGLLGLPGNVASRLRVTADRAVLPDSMSFEPQDFATDDSGAVDLRGLLDHFHRAGGTATHVSLSALTQSDAARLEGRSDGAWGAGALHLPHRMRMPLLPGARASLRLQESYVRDYAVPTGTANGVDAGGSVSGLDARRRPHDPEIGVLETGVDAWIDPAGRLRVAWTTSPPPTTFTTQMIQRGPVVAVDAVSPRTRTAAVDIPEAESVVAVSPLEGGGTAAVHVRTEPVR